jgi:hypothetical protein
MVHAVVGAVLLSTPAAACGRNEGDWVAATPASGEGGAQVHITGVVKRYELEGGFYAIRGEDGVTYDPTNLPPEFQKDGLAVEAEARPRSDLMGTHQVGTIVELERIRLR